MGILLGVEGMMKTAVYAQQLRSLIYNSDATMRILAAARSCSLPNWLIGAGLIRNLVWDHLHEYEQPTPARDVDVAFFDADDLTPERDQAANAQLRSILPDVEWEATNQAAVHLWYREQFGKTVMPLTSGEMAIATWPETATCTAVRLEADDSLTIVAPFGLQDLFEMTLRRNPARVTVAQYRQRYQDKRIAEKWPLVKIV
ncbi:MAG: nucleotidyltransferase family protein [Anaerolineales bacterium]|nr:nucleotidyltransferase family protein [Anaerolineales bacterium]